MVPESKSYSILLIKRDLQEDHFLKKSLNESRIFPSRIDQVASLEEAMIRLKKNAYHLLLMETEMEEETQEELEKIHSTHLPLPFVLLLPVKDEHLLRMAMRCGVADVIVKSESQFHELAEKLRKAFQGFQGKERRARPRTVSEEHEGGPSNGSMLSIRDELTGLYSHGYLYERVVREFARASRYGYPISCMMIGLDGFKKINEDFGYYAGEKVLKEFAALLFENCRMSDFVARYSGKEFCIVLPHSGYEAVKELALRLKKVTEEHVFLKGEHAVQLTLSIGISAFPEDVMTQRADLIRFATEALLHSKSQGQSHMTLFKDVVPAALDDLPSLHISEDKIAGFQRRMADINHSFRKAYQEASKTLIMALEGKDKHTAGHSARTAKFSFWVAQAMGMSRDEAESVRLGTLLHDIGKICIPDSVLLKPGRLTMAEFEVIKQHAFLGYKMLKPIKFLQNESLVVLHHHEWFNGEGYPCRLKGNEIPLGARIAAVTDSYDTICTAGGRYKRTITVEGAVNELIACSGTQFDPEVVQAFIGVLKARGELLTDNYNKEHLESLIKTGIDPIPESA